jgi:hypothetical protein
MPDAQVQIDSLKEDVMSISDTVAMILEKVARHDGRFDRLEGRLAEHDGRFDRIEGQLAEVLRRLPEPQ